MKPLLRSVVAGICASLVSQAFVGVANAQLASNEATTQATTTRPALVKPQTVFPGEEPPAAPREFRGVWVATVQNIDWPTARGLSTADQQKEAIAILDRMVALNMNAVVLQVRTTCDALYDSKLEPWSIYLTGVQGQAPSPYYDPLAFWIEESHKRGLELHAWFNPYRAKHAQAQDTPVSPTHVSVTNPDIVKSYGGFLWLDPGEQAAADQSFNVFMDVVSRYDLDGIHIDDYFYPYPVQNPQGAGELDFPDEPSWQKHLAATGKTATPARPTTGPATFPANPDRADWRRENVNKLIKRIHEGTREIKPHVKFGISPFGIGRTGKVESIRGFDQYEKLYADAALWLQEGWCDYWTPQLYWPIAQTPQSYPVLLDYWISENKKNIHIWPGLYTGKLIEGDVKRRYDAQEPIDQINLTRQRPDASGHVHFSMKVLMREEEGVNLMREFGYATPALIPASPWLDNSPPPAPLARIATGTDSKSSLELAQGDGEPAAVWAVWTQGAEGWSFQSISSSTLSIPLAPQTKAVVVSAVDRTGNESTRVRLAVK